MYRTAGSICMRKSFLSIFAGILVFTLSTFTAPGLLQAGEWRVTPIRLFFERGARSGIVAVQNDGDAPMNFQVKAMEWTQDAEGLDRYSETKELVFFPKLLVVPPKEERVIRVGIKAMAGAREKTYRLFVEEMSPPRKDDGSGGAMVAVNVRFAVPLFVGPVKEEPGAQLLKAELGKGTLNVTLRNTGNVHFRLVSLLVRGRNAKGEETFSRTVDGWYLLNGTTRVFQAQVPAEACGRSTLIEVEGSTDRKIALKGQVAVDRNQCHQ